MCCSGCTTSPTMTDRSHAIPRADLSSYSMCTAERASCKTACAAVPHHRRASWRGQQAIQLARNTDPKAWAPAHRTTTTAARSCARVIIRAAQPARRHCGRKVLLRQSMGKLAAGPGSLAPCQLHLFKKFFVQACHRTRHQLDTCLGCLPMPHSRQPECSNRTRQHGKGATGRRCKRMSMHLAKPGNHGRAGPAAGFAAYPQLTHAY